MSSILLYHHLGLGDHIMCHGIVREYCKKYEQVAIFSYPHNYTSVSFMYRDLSNITIIKGDDAFARKFISDNASKSGKNRYDKIIFLGFQFLDRHSGVPLEKQFYQIAEVPLEKKWDNFFVKRDIMSEQSLFEQVALDDKYVFLHEDLARNYKINRKKISNKYAIFVPEKKLTENIFDYCTIIEKAKEIHVIDSSFMFLIDCLKYDNPEQKLYIHRYSRENNEWQLPILKKDWHILTSEKSLLDPLKNILRWFYGSTVPILNHPIFKRAIRKLFWSMGWAVSSPKQPDLIALIRRYVPGKSFAVVHSRGNNTDKHISLAREAGATEEMEVSLHAAKNPTADIVFYSGILPEKQNLTNVLKQLRSVTNQILILHSPSVLKTSNKKPGDLTASEIETIATRVGFEVRERHLFPLETCFVFRVI